MNNNILNYIPLFAGILNLITAAIVYRKDAAFKINRRFSYLSLSIAIWNIGYFIENSLAPESSGVLLFSKISHLGASFSGSIGLHFIIRFSRVSWKRYAGVLVFTYILSGIISILLFSTSLIIKGVDYYSFGYHVVWGDFYIVHILNLCFDYSIMMYLLIERVRTSKSNIESNRTRYILFGTVIVIVTTLSNFLPAMGFNLYVPGHLGTLIFMMLVLFSIYKYRLMNIKLAVAKYLLLGTFWLSMAILYSAVLYYLKNLFPQQVAENRILFDFIIVGIFVGFYQVGLKYIIPFIERAVYPLKSDLKMMLEELEGGITKEVYPSAILKILLEVIYKSLNVPVGAVYLKGADSDHFKLIDVKGKKEAVKSDTLNGKMNICRLEQVVVKEELKRDIELENFREIKRDDGLSLISEMDELGAEVAFPLRNNKVVFALLLLGRKKYRGVFDSKDVSGLKLLTNRTAEEIVKLSTLEKLKEKENLALIGEMTASIAHEIKNPLGVIKGAAENLLFEGDGKKNRFSLIIKEESDRLDKIVREFLNFARPAEPELEETDICRLTKRCIELFNSEADAINFSIRLEEEPDSINCRLDASFFKQIFYNIVGNSLDANKNGSVDIKIEENLDKVNIEFLDSCGGLSDDILRRIFKPFFTTKTEGTGLGMAIVKKLVEIMDGTIGVKNSDKGGVSTILTFRKR